MRSEDGESTSAINSGAVAVKSLGASPAGSTMISGYRIDSELELNAEFRQDRPFFRIDAGIESLEQICGNLPVRPRAASHHDDASPIELITFLAALDPVEERGLVHAHGQLNIHGRLTAQHYSNPHAMKKGTAERRIVHMCDGAGQVPM